MWKQFRNLYLVCAYAAPHIIWHVLGFACLCRLLEFQYVGISFVWLCYSCWLMPKWPAMSFCIIETLIFFAFLWTLCAFCSIASPNTSNSSNFTWSDHFDLCHEKFKMSLRSLKVLQIYNTKCVESIALKWLSMRKNSEQTRNNSNNKIHP